MRQSTGSSEDQSSGQSESSKSDRPPKATLRELASGPSANLSPHTAASAPASPKRAPPLGSARRTPRRNPQTWLELIGDAIDDWPRTCRLVVLLVATAMSTTTILFVLQLHADKWVSVTAVGASVIAAEGFRRRRNQSRFYRQPPVTADRDDQNPERRAGTTPSRSARRARPQG